MGGPGPSIVSLKFAFWLVCVTFLLHCLMIPTAITDLRTRTLKEKRGVRLTGLKKELYVPKSISQRKKGLDCAHQCHVRKCRVFNFDQSTGECELFETESGGSLVDDPNSSYFGGISDMLCGEMAVENGHTVASGVPDGVAVNIICDAGYKANPSQAVCNKGFFTTASCVRITTDRCILLIGGSVEPSGTAPIEYYHPMDGVECDVGIIGNMSTERVTGDTVSTAGCYLPSTQEVVIREKNTNDKPSIVYGLNDGSARILPLPKNNTFMQRTTAATVGRSKCISCGGNFGGSLDNCYQFDPSLDDSKWTPIAPMPYPSSYPASVSLTERDLYVMGGYYTDTVSHLNVTSGTWQNVTSMSSTRFQAAAAALSETEFIVCGGRAFATGTLSLCEIYDTTLKKWNITGSLNTGRNGLAMINFGGDIYALGGTRDVYYPVNTVEKYDRTTGTWKMAKALKNARAAFIGVNV